MHFQAEIYRLDATAIDAVDPPGDAAAGFDPVFREPRAEVVDGAPVAIRRELPALLLPVQVEDDTFEAMAMHEAGDDPRSQMTLTFHAKDLERAGLIDADGVIGLRPGDRLGAIRSSRGVLVQQIRNPPGLFFDSVTPSGWGLSLTRATRNLVVVKLTAKASTSRART